MELSQPIRRVNKEKTIWQKIYHSRYLYLFAFPAFLYF